VICPDEGTVLDLLLTPRLKHNHDIPGPDVLVDEGCAFIVGGSDTTGYTMEGATYLLLSHPECLTLLRDELDAVMPAIRDYDLQTVLELPFLVCLTLLLDCQLSPVPPDITNILYYSSC
jgi:cytochrome P450